MRRRARYPAITLNVSYDREIAADSTWMKEEERSARLYASTNVSYRTYLSAITDHSRG